MNISPTRWTVLVFADGANDLSDSIDAKVQHLVASGAPEGVSLLVRQANASGHIDDFRITSSAERVAGLAPTVAYDKVHDQDANMGAPETLSRFFVDGITAFPSDKVMVLMDDHGHGVIGCCKDVPHNDHQSLQGVRRALADAARANQNRPVSLVVLDMCMMAQAEVASEWQDVADVIVASQQVGLAAPIDPSPWVKAVTQSSDAEKIGAAIALDAHPDLKAFSTMSALRTSAMPALEDAVRAFSDAVLAMKDVKSLCKAAQKSPLAMMLGTVDLQAFSATVAADPACRELAPLARAMQKAAADVVIAERHAKPRANDFDADRLRQAHGLDINLPLASNYPPNFSPYSESIKPGDGPALNFATRTRWDQVVTRLNGVMAGDA